MGDTQKCWVVGPFNSGTRLMNRYLVELFDNVATGEGAFWKHSLPPHYYADERAPGPLEDLEQAFPGMIFLAMVRSPYYWVASTCRRSYSLQFEERAVDLGRRLRSAVSLKQQRHANLMHLWNSYYRRYAECLEPGNRVRYVRLEDLVRNPLETLRELGRQIECEPRSDVQEVIDQVSPIPSQRGNTYGVAWEEKNRPEHLLRTIRSSDLSYITQFLDGDLLRKFDYSPIWSGPEVA
jgi:hypothetical protein